MTEPTVASTQDIADVIAELEQYRDRLIQDSTETAKKAKLTKSALEAQLAPELETIETALTQLRLQIQNQPPLTHHPVRARIPRPSDRSPPIAPDLHPVRSISIVSDRYLSCPSISIVSDRLSIV